MPSLLSYALIDLATFKEAIDLTGTTDDSQLNGYINRATDLIERYCKRRFKETTYTDETYDGLGGCKLQLKQYPVSALTAFNQRSSDLDNPNFDSIDANLYALDSNSGLISTTFMLSHALNAYEVTYTAGYSTIPSDLQEACIELAAYLYGRRKATPGMKSETLGRYSYTLESPVNGMADPIRRLGLDAILDLYRTPTV